MSSIHYKFRSLVSYKTVNFETLHVSVEELKKAIFDAENLNPETFDLIIENSHTKREYSGNDIIPRNSSLIVKRVPRQDAAKLPKIQDTSTSGIVTKGSANISEMGFIKTDEFSKMTEEQRLEHVKQVSYQKYQPSNYQKKPKYNIMNDPPPPNYVCSRCGKSGHWIKFCPLATIRRTTGLPMDELVETTADDPGAMLHPSGKYMVQKMHLEARLNSKAKAPLPFLRDTEQKPASEDENEKPKAPIQERPPNELICPICNELINEAVVMTCCGSSFCAECIQNMIIEEPGRQCPGEGCDQTLSVDAMVRNVSLRKAVDNFKKKQMQSQWPGLNNRSGTGGQSPAKIEKQQPAPQQKIIPTKSLIPPATTDSNHQIPSTTILTMPNFSLPTTTNNPIVVFPDFSKPPPSVPILTNTLPSSTTATTLPIIQPPIQQPVSQQTTIPQIQLPTSTINSNQQDSTASPFNQDFSTPPHVETPPYESPKQPVNTTLPPGDIGLKQTQSPKRVELSQEAIKAFSAFNPVASVIEPGNLFAALEELPPGVGPDNLLASSLGIELDLIGKPKRSESTKHRSSRRRSRSRSPVRGRYSPYRRRSPKNDRTRRRDERSTAIKRDYLRRRHYNEDDDYKRRDERKKKREKSPSPVSHKRSKKEHKTDEKRRSKSKDRSKSPHKKKRKHRSKAKEEETQSGDSTKVNSPKEEEKIGDKHDDPIDEDENVIDSLIKETTLIVSKDAPTKNSITIAPISNPLVVKNDTLASKNNIDLKKSPHNDKVEEKNEKLSVHEDESKEHTSESQETSPKRKSSTSQPTSTSNSQESSPEKPAFRNELAHTISIEMEEEEIRAVASEEATNRSKDNSPRPKEKLSRKKSDEKKSKHKHKKKKHKKDHKSEESKSKKKKSKDSKEKKHKKKSSKKHRSRSRSESPQSPRRHS